MVTYGDYFSRKTLHACGISPTLDMNIKTETGYTGMRRMENLRADMSEIYQTFLAGLTKKNAQSPTEELARLNVERKIVCAFYDTGVLTNAERDYFQTQTFLSQSQREQISVVEAEDLTAQTRMEKVSATIKQPIVRNVK